MKFCIIDKSIEGRLEESSLGVDGIKLLYLHNFLVEYR